MDFDNRTEFFNAPFITPFKADPPAIELSRAHPSCKNDPAHLEPRHRTPVRVLLGDDRFEPHDLVEPLVPIRFGVFFE